MKTLIETLDATTRNSIQLCIENIKCISRSSAKFISAGIGENALALSSNKAVELVRNIPLIAAHQIVYKKLEIHPLLDPFEVAHFEERRHWSKDIEKYLSQFNVDPLGTNVISEIAIEMSIQLREVGRSSAKYILIDTFINNPILHRAIGQATRDVWGYNMFSGLFHDIDIVKRMTKLDTALNLRHCKSIIPVRVFSDFVEITDNVEIIKAIDEAKETNTRPWLHGRSRNFNGLRDDLEQAVERMIYKYPGLADEGEAHECAKILLNFYTMSPLEVIELLGPNIICCPFELPEKLRLQDYANFLPDPIFYDWSGLHPIIS